MPGTVLVRLRTSAMCYTRLPGNKRNSGFIIDVAIDADHENPLESLGIGSGEGKDAPGAAVGNGKRKLESVFGDGDDKKGSKPKVSGPASYRLSEAVYETLGFSDGRSSSGCTPSALRGHCKRGQWL